MPPGRIGQRAPQRQAYRLVELRRFAQHLNVPLNPEPAHFPVPGDPAAKLIVATDAQEGWVAVETVIDERVVREIIPQLKALGAEGIIEYPLNKLVH